jgi:hypothetical protein
MSVRNQERLGRKSHNALCRIARNISATDRVSCTIDFPKSLPLLLMCVRSPIADVVRRGSRLCTFAAQSVLRPPVYSSSDQVSALDTFKYYIPRLPRIWVIELNLFESDRSTVT